MGAPDNVSEDVQSSTTHVPLLDGLRGAAILLVLASHAIAEPLEYRVTSLDSVVKAAIGTGWIGVDLFFVLSGFLVTGILLDTKGQRRWWSNFVARRALRIFPLYYGALMLLFVVLPHVIRWSDPEFATLQANQRWYWTYAVNWLTGLYGARSTPLHTSHLWSLSIEEQFYLIWPLVVWACSPRGLLRVCALTIIGGFVFRLALVTHDPDNAFAAFLLTPGRLDALMTGAALAVIIRAPSGLARLGAWAPWALRAGAFGLGALAAWRGGLELHDPVIAVAIYPIVALIFGALLAKAVAAPPAHRLARMLSGVSLRKWGKYSYAIYLVHYPVLGALEWKTSFYHQGVSWLGGSRIPAVLVLAVVVAALSYVFAWLSYHFYEKRFLALKRYFAPDGELFSKRSRESSHRSPSWPNTLAPGLLVQKGTLAEGEHQRPQQQRPPRPAKHSVDDGRRA